MNSVKEFSEGAKALARNPLGIIALFIVLVYGFAALTTVSNSTSGTEQKPLICTSVSTASFRFSLC